MLPNSRALSLSPTPFQSLFEILGKQSMSSMSARLIFGTILLASAATTAAPPPTSAWSRPAISIPPRLLRRRQNFPEEASNAGLTQFDGLTADLGPNINERYVSAMQAVLARLEASARREGLAGTPGYGDSCVIDRQRSPKPSRGKYILPWVDVPQLMFGSLRGLLRNNYRSCAARHSSACSTLA